MLLGGSGCVVDVVEVEGSCGCVSGGTGLGELEEVGVCVGTNGVVICGG